MLPEMLGTDRPSTGTKLSTQRVPTSSFVTIEDVGTRWVLSFVPVDGRSVPSISGSIYGTIAVGGAPWQPSSGPVLATRALAPAVPAGAPDGAGDASAFHIDIAADVPQFVISGRLRNDDEIPIGAALSYYFNGQVPPGT